MVYDRIQRPKVTLAQSHTRTGCRYYAMWALPGSAALASLRTMQRHGTRPSSGFLREVLQCTNAGQTWACRPQCLYE